MNYLFRSLMTMLIILASCFPFQTYGQAVSSQEGRAMNDNKPSNEDSTINEDAPVVYPVGAPVFDHLHFGSVKKNLKYQLNSKKIQEKGNKLVYYVEINGLESEVSLFFRNDTLISYKFFFKTMFDSKEIKYLENYNTLESILTSNYLEPTNKIHTWKESCNEQDSSMWARSIINRCLTHATYWEIPDRTIALKTIGAGNRIMLQVEMNWIKPVVHEEITEEIIEDPLQKRKDAFEDFLMKKHGITKDYLNADKLPLFSGSETQEQSKNLISEYINHNFKFSQDTSVLKNKEKSEFKFSLYFESKFHANKKEAENNYLNEELFRVLLGMPDLLPAIKDSKIIAVDGVITCQYIAQGNNGSLRDSIAVLDIEFKEQEPSPQIYFIAEEMPLAPGCRTREETDKFIQHFIVKNLVYPRKAIEENIQGRVFVSFVVETTGEVSNVKILKGIHPLLDAEALRLIINLPDFTPGSQNDKPVRVGYNIPINFKLNY